MFLILDQICPSCNPATAVSAAFADLHQDRHIAAPRIFLERITDLGIFFCTLKVPAKGMWLHHIRHHRGCPGACMPLLTPPDEPQPAKTICGVRRSKRQRLICLFALFQFYLGHAYEIKAVLHPR